MPKLQDYSITDLYKHNTPVTPIQSGAFNTILTNIARHVYKLQQTEDLPKFLRILIKSQQEKTQDISESKIKQQQDQFEIIVHNWHILLNHIYRILLPELYVFFHDDSCTTAQRRKVHKATEGVWNQLKEWQFTTNANYSPLELQIIKQNSVYSPLADDYLIGKGNNANIACKILPLAKLSTISGFQYLEQLAPLFETLSTKKWLLSFISQDSEDMLTQLNHWQKQRLDNFSVPDTQTLYAQPDLLLSRDANGAHPLIRHIQQNMDNGYIVRVSNPNHLQYPAYDNAYSNSNGLIIAEGDKLKKGLAFGSIGLSLIMLAFFLPTVLNIGALVLALPIMGLSAVNLGSTLINHQKPDEENSEESGQIRQQAPEKSSAKSNTSNQPDNILLPINLHRHAFYLARLLSDDGLKLLQKLILTINEAHSYLDYLQEHHPYLATSVHELIMDLTVNSILRLNQLAQNFATEGEIKTQAKALFIKKHEEQVLQLFNNHLEEISDLNASILEKQMAGFATVGSETEREFRDAIMELKILLRWFIAQAPDQETGISAPTTDEILLNRLETTTLKQMQDVFYKHDATTEQRTELLRQIEELLEHFQAQSPKQSHQKNPQTDLLKLTESSDLYQSESQDFIDFNKQYVKQLKQHW